MYCSFTTETIKLAAALLTTAIVIEVLVFTLVLVHCWVKKRKQLLSKGPRILKTVPFKGAVGATSKRWGLRRKQQTLAHNVEVKMKDLYSH